MHYAHGFRCVLQEHSQQACLLFSGDARAATIADSLLTRQKQLSHIEGVVVFVADP